MIFIWFEEYRFEIFESLHCSRTAGHLGFKRALALVQDRFWWPGISRDIKVWIQQCDTCAKHKMPGRKRRAELKQYRVGATLERISTDVLGSVRYSESRDDDDSGQNCERVCV